MSYIYIVLPEPEHPRICGKPLLATADPQKAYERAKKYMLAEDRKEARYVGGDPFFNKEDRLLPAKEFFNKFNSLWNTSPEIHRLKIS